MDRDEMAKIFTPLAEALGWRVGDDSVMAWMAEIPGADHWPMIGPDAIRAAEAEIGRRGLQGLYANALMRAIDPGSGHGIHISAIEVDRYGARYDTGEALAFALITAPPEARVRAMLEVLTR